MAGNPWTDPDPQPGDFDAELDRLGPEDIEIHDVGDASELSILVSVEGEDARRLKRIATERGQRPADVVADLLRSA